MQKKTRWLFSFLLLIFLTFLLLTANLMTGSSDISVMQVLHSLTTPEQTTADRILWQIRFPRVLTALLLGGALSVSGFLLQNFFHNPIAGPFVLGISSGAKLAVAVVMIYTLQKGILLHSGMMILSAFVGAMLSMSLILLIAGKVRNMSMLIVCGVMTGYICSAVTDLLIAFADDANIVNLHNWSMGTFSGTDWEEVKIISILTGISFLMIFCLSKPLYAWQFGEEYAANMGVNIHLFRILLILLSSLLSACVTAFAGPVSFVGIAVPHLVKSLFRTSKPILILPACFLGGAVFCLFCDLLARNLFAPNELSISTVTAVFGAPVVIWLMLQKQKGTNA